MGMERVLIMFASCAHPQRKPQATRDAAMHAADEAHDALSVGLGVVRGAFSRVDDRALMGVSSRVDICVNGSARARDCGTVAA